MGVGRGMEGENEGEVIDGNLLFWVWEEPSLRILLAFCTVEHCK